jgi:uncharacterized protein with NAD-binding domain and iron-sulfur cluster
MGEREKVAVAVVGGGCAGISAAFELTRPEHQGRYKVTVYQQGWRLGGKGASGRGPANRIEEHGFHVWMGFYENAFRLLRECYAELNRDPLKFRIAEWHQVFVPENHIGVVDRDRHGRYSDWLADFPKASGLPGDPIPEDQPVQVRTYLVRLAALLRTLLRSCQNEPAKRDWSFDGWPEAEPEPPWPSAQSISDAIARLAKLGVLATMAGAIEAVRLLESVLASLAPYPDHLLIRLLDEIAQSVRRQLELLAREDDETRRLFEIVDLILAVLRGSVSYGLATDSRGLDAIDDYDWREWLQLNGASPASLDSAFLRGVYALMFAYEGGDPARPRMAAGQALRGAFRMFLTYRGALFWKMRAGMGDVIFAPFYEVLRDRGVTFRFFHRLENVRVVPADRLAAGEEPYVEALEFDVQAEVKVHEADADAEAEAKAGTEADAEAEPAAEPEYEPLVDVRDLPCWRNEPDWSQLVDGDLLEQEGRDFESFWDHGKQDSRRLEVTRDFDFVVLGVGLGAIPHVAKELVERDRRWHRMVEKVATVETAAVQLWLRESVAQLGWQHPSVSVSGFVQPFETWADMPQLVRAESWRVVPEAIAYFCGVLPDGGVGSGEDPGYPARRREEVRVTAIDFLDRHVGHFWPKALRRPGEFRWELLIDPAEVPDDTRSVDADSTRLETQFYAANVNPSDRYVLSLPGTACHRISPLDTGYDNLTVAGDWTECGHNAGCVEAAVMSGRLAAHAISQLPELEQIVGYDHP